MDAAAVDAVRLNFDPSGLLALNAVIGLMMFGIALDLKLGDFTRIIKSPKAPAIGLGAQFILLPAFTFLLTLVLPISPSIALGMILVASCPGGNLSNMMTYLAGGNAAVSVSMTAVSTGAAVVMTPLNLAVWGSLNPATASILREVSLSPVDVFFTIVMIMGIPMVAGMLVGRWFPGLVDRVRGPFKIFAVCVFLAVVGGALAANWQNFMRYVGLVAVVVALHNAMALSLGYTSARLFRLPPRRARGGHRGGHPELGPGPDIGVRLFRRPGGMAIITAWWGCGTSSPA